MKLIPLTNLLIGLALLNACAHQPLMVARPGDAIESDRVSIYYPDRPSCDYETVAYIQVTGGYFSLESMFRKMRQQAAAIGADGVYVMHTQQLDIKEYLATAKAIRCLPVQA